MTYDAWLNQGLPDTPAWMDRIAPTQEDLDEYAQDFEGEEFTAKELYEYALERLIEREQAYREELNSL